MDYPSSLQQEDLATSTDSHTLLGLILPFALFFQNAMFFPLLPFHFSFFIKKFYQKTNILDHSLLEYTWQSIKFCGKK